MATEVKKVYSLDIQGADSVNELKTAIEQLTEKLKSLNEQSKEYKDTLQQLNDLQSKLASTMSGAADSTQKANDSLKSVKDTAQSAKENLQSMGEATQQAKQNLDSMGEATTIKELRAEIKTLREELYNLEIGSDEYDKVAQKLTEDERRLKETMTGVKESVKYAEGSYYDLSQQLSQLKREWKSTNDESERNAIGEQMATLNARLSELDHSYGNWTRNVGNYKSALEGLDSEYVTQRRELKDLKAAMEQLDPSSQAYAEAFQRAAEITHNLSEQQEMLKYSSTDIGDQLSNMRGIAANLAAGYGAVNAAMGLFGEENENVKEALLKVQQTMALIQGLQGLDGFIKRTQGLSTAMKAWIATSKTAAKTTAQDAAASAADAAAKGAEATATAGAVAPQLALNAAMKANPIGFIIGLVASLVTIFMLLKDKILELIGGNKEMSATFDKVKAVISGFANIIKKSIINPIKLAIIPIKTLGKVLKDVFTGNWDEIGQHIREGAEETAEVVKDSINVIGQFKEGYDKKMGELNEAARKKEAEARSKELDDQIKDMEAKLGSDKKYTEEAKKLYEEYFEAKLAMYDKDSEEYKQAVRDKWTYEREFEQKQQEAVDKANKEQEAKNKKATEDAKKAAEKRLSDFKSAFNKYMPSGVTVEMNFKDMKVKWKKGLKDFKAWFKKQYKDLFNDINFDEMWNKVVADYIHGQSDIVRVNFENTIKPINDMANRIVDEKALTNKVKEFKEGLKFPDDYINTLEEAYEVMDDNISDTTLKLQSAKREIEKYYEEVYAFIDDEQERNDAINKAKSTDTSYQALLVKERELQNQRNQLVLNDMNYRAEIAKKGYDKEVDLLEDTYSKQEKYYQNLTDLKKSQLFLYGDRTEESLEAEQENTMYELRIANLNKLAEAYRKMANDTTLSAEERKNAEIDLKNTLFELENAEVAHTVACNERRKESWKNTLDYMSTAAQGTSTLLGNVADAMEDSINRELNAGKISQKEAERRFENVKKVQKAQALINTFTAAISAFQSMASIPYVGPVLGAAAAAAAIAAGMVQVHNIESTTLSSAGGGGTSSSSSAYQLPSVLTPEPQYTRNLTGQNDTDELANVIGGKLSDQRVYIVESDISDSLKKSNKRKTEVTF